MNTSFRIPLSPKRETETELTKESEVYSFKILKVSPKLGLRFPFKNNRDSIVYYKGAVSVFTCRFSLGQSSFALPSNLL